jgi:hypothetical protein
MPMPVGQPPAMNSQPRLDSPRVFAAADALLEAVQSPSGKDAVLEVMFPNDRATRRSDDDGRFSPDELVLAMDFLIRAGFMEDQE